MSEIASVLTVIGIILVTFSIISGFIIKESTAHSVRLMIFLSVAIFFCWRYGLILRIFSTVRRIRKFCQYTAVMDLKRTITQGICVAHENKALFG
jgi:uncharacterized membrane protein